MIVRISNLVRPFAFGLLAFTSVILSVDAAHSQTENEIVLKLPPSKEAVERQSSTRSFQMPSTPSGSLRGHSSSSRPNRGNVSSRKGSFGKDVVVGRLGLLERPTGIHRGHYKTSPTLITAESGTYVAIKQEYGDWFGVLMADGSIGWTPRASVRIMDYQVVSNQPVYSSPASPSGVDPGDNFPFSAAPYFNGDSNALLEEAYKYLGVKYVWGGNTYNGIDCSGFIKNVFRTQGLDLPRLGSDQMAFGAPVPRNQLSPGDRLYFGRRTERLGVTHTGLYIGNGYFIHASSSRKGVAISRLSESWFDKNLCCARR